MLYTFRYDDRYVEPETKKRWEGLEPGTPVLVVFSLQQRAEFQPPVFFPVRMGEIAVPPKIVGSRHLVRFRLARLVSLPLTEQGHKDHVAAFTRDLEQHVRGTPYGISASIGGSLSGATEPRPSWDAQSLPDTAFEQLMQYLARTETFERSSFYRVRRIAAAGSDVAIAIDRDGVLHLDAGRTYNLEFVHAQRGSPTAPEFVEVGVDGSVLRVIGHPSFAIASRYDMPVVRLSVTPSNGLEHRETVLDIPRRAPSRPQNSRSQCGSRLTARAPLASLRRRPLRC